MELKYGYIYNTLWFPTIKSKSGGNAGCSGLGTNRKSRNFQEIFTQVSRSASDRKGSAWLGYSSHAE